MTENEKKTIGADFYNQSLTGDVSKTLATASASDPDHVPGLLEPGGGGIAREWPRLKSRSTSPRSTPATTRSFALAGNLIGRAPENGSNGRGYKEEVSYTLDTIGVFGVVQTEKKEMEEQQRIFTLDADRSNSMKSANPDSGIHESDVAKTLDTTTPTPQKAQGGQMIVSPNAYEHHPQDSRVKPTEVAPTCGVFGNSIEGKDCLVKQGGGEDAPRAREETPGVPRLSVRRLMPIETERLMGFPEIDVLEVYRMTKDEFIAFEIATGNIIVDAEKGLVYTTRGGGGRKLDAPRLLEGTETPTGYLVVSLREKNDKRQIRIHRIIWTAVHGIIPEGMTIDHINNDKHDNRIENLQLMTAVDNSKKAHEEGIVPHHKKFTEEQDFEAFSLYVNGMKVKDILLRMGMSKGRFYELLNRVGWTQIPWRGKPADECPDAPRYKACGNSMGVNCMRWIGLGIEAVEDGIRQKQQAKRSKK